MPVVPLSAPALTNHLALRIVVLLSLAALAVPGESLARTAVAAPPVTLEHCSWNRPGSNPFQGDVVSAVDSYDDIAPAARARLKARMAQRAYDDVVTIGRASITGRATYGSTIRDMHFGHDRICHEVSRAGWSATMHERGLVYCEERQCILVPTICRNVSRISRAEVADEPIVAAAPPQAALPPGIAGPVAPTDVSQEPLGEKSFVTASEPSEEGGAPGIVFYPGVVIGGGGGTGPTGSLPIPPVPEPGTWALMLAGAAMAAAWRHRLSANGPVLG